MPKLIRFQMLLTPKQLEALRARRDETGTPVAEQIRQAVAEKLKEKQVA